jgi:CDP-diacylglycerol---serine O-phosphatidyltransferase
MEDKTPTGDPNRRRRMKRPRRLQPEQLRKGIYILPNLVTTGGMACGFYSIIRAIDGDFKRAAWLIVAASIFDLFDGRVARMTKTTSEFGVQYDSLSDLAAFGVAPAVLLYLWALKGFNGTGWLASFLFFVCGALRLARFNVQAAHPGPPKKNFTGLPIPFAANTVAATVILWDFVYAGKIGEQNPFLHSPFLLVLVFALAFLMVSTIPYRSFKDLDLKGGRSFQALVFIIVAILLVLSNPPVMLFGIAMLYVAHGPLMALWHQTRRGTRIPAVVPDPTGPKRAARDPEE